MDGLKHTLGDDVRKIKICLVGDMGTGKTCLCLRFVKNLFTACHRATISDIETKVVEMQGNHVIYQIWDTAGQERFRSLLPLYLRGIDGAIVVYDLTSKKSFENLPGWVTEVRKYSENQTVLMAVGNKLDIVNENPSARKVDAEAVKSWCMSQDLLHHEASAKTGDNVHAVFMSIGEEILKRNRASAVHVPFPQQPQKPESRTCCS